MSQTDRDCDRRKDTFESSVILQMTQTEHNLIKAQALFDSSVIGHWFENSVIL